MVSIKRLHAMASQMSKRVEGNIEHFHGEKVASFLKEDSVGTSKRRASSTLHGENIKRINRLQMEGDTMKASPVEVAAPYFSKSSTKPTILDAASILTSTDGYFREDGKQISEYKVDFEESIFLPITTGATNSLIAMCHLAFAEHRPMAVTPDLLWHYIVRGISTHIHKYSEELRKKFVSHEGKKELTVFREKLDLDADDWSSLFKEFRTVNRSFSHSRWKGRNSKEEVFHNK